MTTTTLRALIAEDSDDDTELLVVALRRGGFAVEHCCVQTADAMRARLQEQEWDLVISDFSMPSFTAFDALAQLHASGHDIPFIIVSGTIGEDRAVLAMKAGAHDYIFKGNLKRLVPAVNRELREARMRSEHRESEARARYLAYHDPLTGLPNRTRFVDAVRQSIIASLAESQSMAIMLMDLERFKEVNDTLGHRHGDRLLCQVADGLRSVLPASAMVARLGGDEFGVLLPRVDEYQQVGAVARQLQEQLKAPVMIAGIPIAVEASIGVALVPQHASDADGLLQRAEMAMYHAKQSGAGYSVFVPQHDAYSPQRLALMAELRDAIDNDELVLHYQPIVDLNTRQVVGAEALVRWQHPVHGLLMPDSFIGIAEHTGLMRPLTDWVLRAGLRQCRRWTDAGQSLRLSINLSARSVHDIRLPDRVDAGLREHGVAATQLKLEITESALFAEPARAIEVLTALRRLGVALSIDDFGTGYTSLNNIKRLPVDEVKIDQVFVLNLLRDERDAAIVQSIIELGHNLGLSVVAEGVEDASLFERLVTLECDHAQGYHISRPLPVDAFDEQQLSGWALAPAGIPLAAAPAALAPRRPR